MDFDANKDGKITQEELPAQMQQRFGRMDENGDGAIDQEEVDSMRERTQGNQGRRAAPPGRANPDRI
jgi:Ca2+-binding EF-hand superfamily protein